MRNLIYSFVSSLILKRETNLTKYSINVEIFYGGNLFKQNIDYSPKNSSGIFQNVSGVIYPPRRD